jgi:hypothetical protein
MSRRGIFLFVSALVMAAAVVGAAAWVIAARTTSAQEPDGGREALATRTVTSAEEPAADLEAFRAGLIDYYGDLLELYPYIADFAPAGLEGRIVQAQKDVASLTPDELAELEKAFAEDPAMLDATKQLLPLVERLSREQPSLGRALEGGVGSPGGCGTSIPAPALYAVKGVSLGLEQALHYVPQTLDVEVGLIIVVVTSMPHPAKVVLHIIKDVVDWAILGMEANNAWVDSCRGDLLENNLDEKVSTRADQDTVDDIEDTVADIEAAVRAIETAVGGIDTAISDHDTNVTNRANAIDTAIGNHDANLNTRATAIDTAIGNHDANLNTRATAIDTAISDHDASLDYAVDNLVEPRQLHLEVTQLKGARRFLVAVTDAGRPLAGLVDADMSVQYAPETYATLAFQDAAIDQYDEVTDGVYELRLSFNGSLISGPVLFAFEVAHNGLEDHYGFTVFHGVVKL